jgi:hypothetical protein
MEHIETAIHTTVFSFLSQLAEEYSLPVTTLKERWSTFIRQAKHDEKVVQKKTPQKKSTYQNFFVQKRLELKQKNPELDFGQLSTQISKMWSALSKEEQNAYALPACVQKEKKSVELDATVLKEKKMSELRQLCEERGLKRTGNKSELIRTLLEKQETVPQTVPKVNFTRDIEHDSLEVDMLNTIIKRADIEEGEANLESEEEDFDFDEEENYEADVFEE